MHLSKTRITESLIPALNELRTDALSMEQNYLSKVVCIDSKYQPGAKNLLHYLAIRQSDIRELQQDLAQLGLSRLGRAEAHAMSSIDAVLAALRALAGSLHDNPALAAVIDLVSGDAQLAEHADALLGMAPENHSTRVMVTMPPEAAVDAKLVHDLLVAGMNIMRINCAHDTAEDWLSMIAHLRKAEQATGKTCKVYADLSGPKLRTGEIHAIGRMVEIKVDRDAWGRVTVPARILLTPDQFPEDASISVDAVLPMNETVVSAMRAGDLVEVDDARGSTRRLQVKERVGISWIAHCHQHAFIEDGASCRLYRHERLLVQGKVSPLPEVFSPIVLKIGDELMLTRDQLPGSHARYDDMGNLLHPAFIPCTLDAVFDAAIPGQSVWFDDGKIGAYVTSNDGMSLIVKINHAAPQGGKLRAGKGINLPETDLDIPALTATDMDNLRILSAHIDLVGLSFVRTADDVEALHRYLDEIGAADLGVVLKIETRQAFENLPVILLAGLCRAPVGVMVARGDLAVEIGFERLAEVQEEILWLCEAAHVPVIWATQVLESMAKNGMPSRAEVSDAAMSIGAECVMLNKGPFIVETVRFLSGVLERMSGHRIKRRPMMRKLSISQLPLGASQIVAD